MRNFDYSYSVSSPAARENARVQRNFSRLVPRLRGEQGVQVGNPFRTPPPLSHQK